MTRYVVILAGGDRPGSAPPELTRAGRALIAERAGLDTAAARAQAGAAIAVAWTVAMAAARDHYRPRAAYVVDDETEAARLAELLTAEVDPAWYLTASDPLHQAIGAWQLARATADGYARAAAAQPGYVVTAEIAEDGEGG